VEPFVERACGLDVHQLVLMAVVMVTTEKGKVRREQREFSTMSDGLRELVAWLKSLNVTHVAMESTGVYWMPIYAVLEQSHFDITVANAQHIKNVPGRKTDMSDAAWIAQLLRLGMLRKSFVPHAPFRALRELTRSRRNLIQDRTREVQRLQRLLVTANVKLTGVISDIFGVSGVEMVRALVEGVKTPAEIAQLARGTMRQKIPLLTRALDGVIEEHHRLLLRLKLQHIDMIDQQIGTLDGEIARRFEPYREDLQLVTSVTGVDIRGAEDVLAETGVDMTAFANDRKIAAWAGTSPGNNQSAKKDLGARRRKGNVHLTTILVELALGASRTKGSYLRDKYHRLKARRGAKRALLAIANKLIRSIWHVLSERRPYQDLGDAYLDSRDRDRVIAGLLRRLETLGVALSVTTHAVPAATADTTARTE
jgi:transposase